MKPYCLFSAGLFKSPYHLVFGELCLFPMGALYSRTAFVHSRDKKLMHCIHDINSLLLTIRMASKSSSARHLFKTENVFVLRNTGTDDAWGPG